MKNMLMKFLVTGVMLLLTSQLWAANARQTVEQVTTTVELQNDVDYIVTSDTPFSDEGLVNIINTEHAVVILQSVKPSVAVSKWLKYVQINGTQAKNNTNCQVKIYRNGCIIMPYANTLKPLTTFTERDFTGESCNNYGMGNSGGYMNTLTANLLNNQIRSFKLKRGYMVTFSTQSGGRGYSRCFIAANNDLEISELPPVLDQKISSYRIFKWYDAGKKQLANCTDRTVLNALNVQSSYDWGQGNNSLLPDYEWVPNHIYEDWPSSSTIGGTSQSPHCKNNNEPLNSADDRPQDLTTILNNWENMMRTGLRLCSPASWDGSDYDNATGFLAQFLDSIDARGWRCDIIDLHCYWPESKFNNLHNWSDKYKRPIWISEWCWGASWNKNGAFASGVTQAQVKSALQNICSKLNNYDYVERYYYWNNEAAISKVYNNKLTPAGEYYASMIAPMGYNGKYDFVPTTPRQYGPSKFKATVQTNGKTRLAWYDSNGEYNQLMEVQMKDETGRWVVLDTIQQKETASNYTYDVNQADENIKYRVHLIDLNGKEYYTSDELNAGDVVDVDGQTFYAGGNLLLNGDFDLGFTDWTNGQGKPLTEPQFQVVGAGGYHNNAYLQAHLSGGMNAITSVKKVVELMPNQNYIFRVATINSGNYVKMALSADGSSLTKEVAKATNGTAWNLEKFVFNSDTYSKGILAFYTLAAKAQIDAVELRPLFASRDEAVAHGNQAAQLIEQAETAYEEQSTALADEISRIATTLAAIENKPCQGYNQMKELLAQAQNAQTRAEAKAAVSELQLMLDTYLAFVRSPKQPKYGSFASEKSDGWETKVGTYTGGDQKATTKFGKTCWNSWWSTTSKTATMEIRQTVTGLPEGYYELECKATTEHFCISDQHGYLKCGDMEAVTPTMSHDWFDLPVSDNEKWETLTTTPVYVPANGSVTLGFKSSKEGAHTGWWHSFGNASGSKDNREGWWCATGFVLKYHAIDDLSGISTPRAERIKADGVYGMDGRKQPDANQLPQGLYIKVENGQAKKLIVK